ncbi:Cytosine deaminase [Paenibacillus konkukensis]|uniref:Cytosine deaminase n=1 Tax=Paenibacillus konkukensis TaxID=2020716 RepID=A0ABY4RGQ6_9BACL|nr:amidohydrolase family protein [Paenibacillus konkukensis]UQZ81407.1 Cytosine deaminase [Paenibacillus konkukensis]
MNNSRLLFANVRLPGGGNLKTIEVDDGNIIRVSDAAAGPQTDQDGYMDMGGRLLLPGMVDIHMHLDKAMTWPELPNASGTLLEAIRRFADAQPLMETEDLIERMTRTIRLALRHGTTTIRTHLDYGSPSYCAKAVEAYHTVKERFRRELDLQAVLMCPPGMDEEAEAAVRRAVADGGIDAIGGAPHLADAPERQLDRLFDMAVSLDVDLDLHIDESDDPKVNHLPYLCRKTVEVHYEGRVIAGHCTSLSAMEESQALEIMAAVKEAGIGIVTLPACNLFLQGRQDKGLVRRGLTRVKQLAGMGVPVAIGSDNVRDPFHPYGNADLLHSALLASYGAHMTTEAEMNKLIAMITSVPAELLRLDHYGLRPGGRADFVLLDCEDAGSALAVQPAARETWKRGRRVCRVTESVTWEEP